MKNVLLSVITLAIVGTTVFSCQSDSDLVKVNVDDILYLINEDIVIIESEIESYKWELRDQFFSMDKYGIGESMFLLIDSVETLTNKMLQRISKVSEKQELSIINTLHAEHDFYRENILKFLENYLRANSDRLAMTEIEITTYLSNANEDLSLRGNYDSDNLTVLLKMLESHVMRNKHSIISRVGSMYSYHGNRHVVEFPAVMNFGMIQPIRQNEVTQVKIGVQSYEIVGASDMYQLVIRGDTLKFNDQNPFINYSLPTDIHGENELLVKLLSQNELTGEVFETESSFKYYVNK